MKKGLIGCLVVLGGLLLLALIFGSGLMRAYNGLVTERETVDKSWAQVENVLQRRGDLIPNLVETVKGYASHEKEVFESVAEARGRLAGATTPQEATAANAGMTSALGRLLAISENYPELKANENFIRLQDELAGSENRIAVERNRYNEAARVYNTHVKTFPANLIAGFFGFKEKDYFQADAAAKEVPKVKF
ncbi:MAG TPA: LemA family protein [Patescibacteria group bacterium]|jgi:LemA protein|nr:LemA family protein [Patescibacteria group bacterium]